MRVFMAADGSLLFRFSMAVRMLPSFLGSGML